MGHYYWVIATAAMCCSGMVNGSVNSTMLRKRIRGSRLSRKNTTSTHHSPGISPRRENKAPLVRIKKRLLWRNTTPFDDDDYSEADEEVSSVNATSNSLTHNNGIRPGLVAVAMQNSTESGDAEAGDEEEPDRKEALSVADFFFNEETEVDETADADNNDTVEIEEETEVDGTADADDNDTVEIEDEEDGIETENEEGEQIDQQDENLYGNETSLYEDDDFTSNTTDSVIAFTPNEEEFFDKQEILEGQQDVMGAFDVEDALENVPNKLDCSWRVLTGTGCTSMVYGDIIGGHQHESLVADGTCRYNDFLGYYRAGCSKEAVRGVPMIHLSEVFCSDPNCSSGCMSDSVVRSNVQYASNHCYLSGYYDEGEDKIEVTAARRQQYDFAFEFIGGCLETENCDFFE